MAALAGNSAEAPRSKRRNAEEAGQGEPAVPSDRKEKGGNMWGKVVKIARKHTGEYFLTESGETGEAVHWHNWGGVDILFQDGAVATYAVGDLVRAKAPSNAAQFARFTFDEAGRVVKGE